MYLNKFIITIAGCLNGKSRKTFFHIVFFTLEVYIMYLEISWVGNVLSNEGFTQSANNNNA